MAPQKLIALDEDDLAVISAHLQEARVRMSDIAWRESEKRLVIAMERLDWEGTLDGEPTPDRLISALRFDRVLSTRSRNIDPSDRDTSVELLGIEFAATEPPGGVVTLLFSSRGAIRLEVECLECELADLGISGAKAE